MRRIKRGTFDCLLVLLVVEKVIVSMLRKSSAKIFETVLLFHLMKPHFILHLAPGLQQNSGVDLQYTAQFMCLACNVMHQLVMSV